MTEYADSVSFELLLLWPVLVALLLLIDRRLGRAPIFLSYVYIANLAIQHWLGGLAHAMPWRPFLDSTNTIVGMRYTTLALASFVVGTIIVMRPVRGEAQPRDRAAVLAKGWRCTNVLLVAGIIGWILEMTPLNGLPSITSVISAAKQLLVAGICLRCWLAWHTRNYPSFYSWLALSAAFPVYTAVVTGFIGFGIAFMMTILIFVGTFFRPRALLVAGGVVAIYCGVSFFVAYLAGRDQMRAAVWGESSFERRLETVLAMVEKMKPLDLGNPEHLQALDTRLNQNELVGAAVAHTPSFHPFADGFTIWQAVIAMIPRILWPDKPVTAGSMGIVSQYTGITFADSTSVGVGPVMEFYVNFGTAGVIGGFLVIGVIVRYVDLRMADALRSSDWGNFAFWFLIGGAASQTTGMLLEVTASVVAAYLLGLGVLRYLTSGAEGAPARLS